jgi:uncharacterized membrane-anchored protein
LYNIVKQQFFLSQSIQKDNQDIDKHKYKHYELIKRATKDLLVNKNATSKYRFSKISAPDDRRSSSGMGFVAILITSMPIILIVVLSAPQLSGIGTHNVSGDWN